MWWNYDYALVNQRNMGFNFSISFWVSYVPPDYTFSVHSSRCSIMIATHGQNWNLYSYGKVQPYATMAAYMWKILLLLRQPILWRTEQIHFSQSMLKNVFPCFKTISGVCMVKLYGIVRCVLFFRMWKISCNLISKLKVVIKMRPRNYLDYTILK